MGPNRWARAGVIMRYCKGDTDCVLLVQTRPMYNAGVGRFTDPVWGFPKGQQQQCDIEEGGDATDALLRCAERELFEETALVVRLSRDHQKIRLGTTKFIMCWVDSMAPLSYDLIADKREISAIRWVAMSDLRAGVFQLNHSLRDFLTKQVSWHVPDKGGEQQRRRSFGWRGAPIC